GVEESLELGLIVQLDLDEPTLVIRILVHDVRMIVELGVDRDDLTGDGRDELVDRLHRLELAERLALLHLVADAGQLDRADLTELVLRVFRDAEMRARSFDAQPEVIVRELQRIRHVRPSSTIARSDRGSL